MHINSIWQNKRVLLTGHTGFKGSWLSIWLHHLGAEVHGIALDPPSEPNLFTEAKVASLLKADHRIDIRDYPAVSGLMQSLCPDVVFHLAAQPLVQYSYDFPLETYAVNVMGTANILEAIRWCDTVQAAVIVTTDKCYENREWIYPYREADRLGGADPYSNSKACAELVSTAYRQSFLANKLNMATARAGNVIGGGDWAADRLIPDCIRAFAEKRAVTLRYPKAIRPWQHVLSSIHGYLLLAEHLLSDAGTDFAQAWNFGPEDDDMKSVGEVANKICSSLNVPINLPKQSQPRHEASLLRIDSAKAKQHLKWHPHWNLQQTIEETIAWYRHWLAGSDMLTFTDSQIAKYLNTKSSVIPEGKSQMRG